MAQEHRPEKSISELRQEIAHSRDRLARDLGGLGYELDFPLKFRKSFQRQSKLWIAAAVIIGVALTVRPGRRKKQSTRALWSKPEAEKSVIKAGLAMGALRLAGTLLRPIVVSLITKKLRGYAAGANRKW